MRRERKNISVFFAGILTILFFVVADELLLSPFLGITLLATLITLAFFLNFLEYFTLTLFSAFIMNWKPALSFDLALFFVIPLIAYLVKEVIPGSEGVNNMILLMAGIPAFYFILIARYGLTANALDLFGGLFWGISFSILAGMLLYQVFHLVYSA